MPGHHELTIGKAYPWGRSLDEYQGMFALSPDDLAGKIIGCADGPASFNCESDAPGRPRGFLRSALPIQRRADSLQDRANARPAHR